MRRDQRPDKVQASEADDIDGLHERLLFSRGGDKIHEGNQRQHYREDSEQSEHAIFKAQEGSKQQEYQALFHIQGSDETQ